MLSTVASSLVFHASSTSKDFSSCTNVFLSQKTPTRSHFLTGSSKSQAQLSSLLQIMKNNYREKVKLHCIDREEHALN